MNSSSALRNRPLVLICAPCRDSVERGSESPDAGDFEVRHVDDGRKAIEDILAYAPDLVLLDTNLPGHGGYEVCKRIRPHYKGPVIILGHTPDDAAHLLAFERGADDYIPWPVSQAVLAAKIMALIARRHGLQSANAEDLKIRAGNLEMDALRREVFLCGKKIELTAIQFEVLWVLMKRAGRVVSREELYEALHKGKYNGYDRSVDVYISRIRRLLDDDSENPTFLKTVRSAGYLFVGDDQRVF